MSVSVAFDDLVSPDVLSEEINTLIDTLHSAWAYADWNKERIGLDLEDLRRRYLETVSEPMSYAKYYEALTHLAVELADGHASVAPPKMPEQEQHVAVGSVGATFGLIGKDVYVKKIIDEGLWDPVPMPGDRLIRLGGEPTDKLLSLYLAQITGSGLRHRRARLERMLPLIFGSLVSSSGGTLVFESPDGTQVTTHARPHTHTAWEAQPISLEWVKPSIAHVKVPSFTPAQWFSTPDNLTVMPGVDPRIAHCIEAIDAVFTEASEATTLILDLRGNEGGTDTLGKHLACHLLQPGFTYYELETRYSEFFQRNRLTFMKLWATKGTLPPGMDPSKAEKYLAMDVETVDLEKMGLPTQGWSRRRRDVPKSPSGIQPFSGKVILLIDGLCFSSADNLIACLQDEHPELVTIGETTGGGTGAPRAFTLPHTGFSFAFCTMKVYRPSGGLIEGVGSAPDVAVTPTPDDWRANRDPALSVALQLCGH